MRLPVTQRVVAFALTLVCLASLPAFAQQETGQPAAQETAEVNTAPAEAQTGSGAQRLTYLSQREFWMSLEVLGFGLVVLLLQFGLLFRKPVQPEEVLRMFGVTLILVGTLFAITAGFSAEDIGPALGLFGTVAGYLLGRRTQPPGTKKEARHVEPAQE